MSLTKQNEGLWILDTDRKARLGGLLPGTSDDDATTYGQFNGLVKNANSDDIAAGAGGAISVSNYYTTINTDAGGDAFTLADGTTDGQLKKIQLIVDGGGDGVITPANFTNGTTITMADAGDFAILRWSDADGAWRAIELGNAADGVTAPVIA